MNELAKVFQNEEFGDVRVVIIDNEPWFLGKDILHVLQYSNPNEAIRMHVDEEDRKRLDRVDNSDSHLSILWDSDQDRREKIIINESGLYSLILRSKLPSAKKFKHWVTSEVLPSIRKNGMYAMPSYAEALRGWAQAIEEKEKLAAENAEMRPKAGYFDDLIDRKLHTNVRDTAKELGMKQKQFVKWLIDHEYVYRDAGKNLRPYSQYVGEDNLFVLKDAKSHFNEWAGIQMLVTVRGKETFRLLLQGLQSFSNNEEDDGQLTLDLE